jgi:hypothetical protein
MEDDMSLFRLLIVALVVGAGAAGYYLFAPRSSAEIASDVDNILQSDSYKCAHLTKFVRKQDVRVKGFVSNPLDLSNLKDEIANIEGVQRVDVRAKVVIWPHCMVAKMMQPYIDDVAADMRPMVRVHADTGALEIGNDLILSARAPGYDAYLYVDYYDREGNVIHMLPSPSRPKNRLRRNSEVVIGRQADGRAYGIHYPVGTALITVVASAQPLFARVRPEVERAETYLADLEAQVKAQGGLPVSAHKIFIETTAGDNGRNTQLDAMRPSQVPAQTVDTSFQGEPQTDAAAQANALLADDAMDGMQEGTDAHAYHNTADQDNAHTEDTAVIPDDLEQSLEDLGEMAEGF